jgi:membrane associated rhomboid family serine protease
MYQSSRPSNFSNFPPVVKNLLIINGLCFLAYAVLESRGLLDMNKVFGLYYPESTYFKPFQLITHVFMHGSFMHLFFNMFSLWMFGSVLENYWGAKRFFIYYFVTAFGAAALHLGINAIEVYKVKAAIAEFYMQADYDAFFKLIQQDSFLANDSQVIDFLSGWKNEPNSPSYLTGAKEITDYMLAHQMNIPVVGASGAVFGLLLGFGMLFPNTTLMMLFIPFPIKAKYFVILYGALELYQGISANPADNVAHFAHLGGMLFGFVMIKIWNKHNRQHFY